MKNHMLAVIAALTVSFGASAAPAAPPDQPNNVRPAPGSRSETMAATKDKMGHAVGVISAEMTTTTNGFVTAAATSDMYELAAAKIVIDRTHNSAVKRFARTMLSAHTKTTDELTSILATEKLSVTPPSVLDVRRQTMINNLHGMKDADFDERYISQQVDAHEEALILMRGYHNSGDNKALKAFAGSVENAVKMHLGMAERLNKSLAREEKAESR